MSAFTRYVGIDYSGAQTPTASLKGLRVYLTERGMTPVEVAPPPSPRKYWTRRGVAEWLVKLLSDEVPTLVGIDHGFSFPISYFDQYPIRLDWQGFLDDFEKRWPTASDTVWVRDILRGDDGRPVNIMGDPLWFRLTEKRSGKPAKSVFNFRQKQGCVAFSTHAGIPWLRFIRQQLRTRVHFWPFDGWDIPPRKSVIAEVYPALWSRGFARESRTSDQHDAFSIAAWLTRADGDGGLADCFSPRLTSPERSLAEIEGWILGVTGQYCVR
jgi:hypothetical protein